ncbi:MAG: DUF4931 domain-containing protein [Streptococcus salivarius]
MNVLLSFRPITNIIDKNDGLLWLDNKYNTIENTYQTIIIESEDHYGDISNYSYAYIIEESD